MQTVRHNLLVELPVFPEIQLERREVGLLGVLVVMDI
jgi:hypothetical protein